VIKVFYLGAVGRSGTTLLERALATSPSYVSLGEVVHLWERGLLGGESCGCGVPLTDCPFWREVGEVAFGGWGEVDANRVMALRHAVDRNRYIPWLLVPRIAPRRFRAQRAELLGILSALYGAVVGIASRDASGPLVLVDASKHPSYYLLVRALPLVDVYLLHVVRDPRGVAHSWSKVVTRPEAGDDMERLGTLHSIGRWVSHNMALSLAGVRHRRRLLRYEAFAAHPGHLADVASALIADPAVRPPLIEARRIDLQINHTVSGNPMRFATGPVDIRADAAWATSMPKCSRLAVTLATAPLRWWYR